MSLLLACSDDKASSSVPELAGSWYGTDLHLHSAVGSNDTDGSTVADYAEVAGARGLSLAIITDHSNSAGSMDCETGDVEDCINQGPEFPAYDAAVALSRPGLALAVGVEVSPVHSLQTTSEPTGHVGCLPRTMDAFQTESASVIDRPAGTVPGGDGLEWCRSIGGFAVVNHPFSIAGWISYDWSSSQYDALEVFNGGARFDANDAQAVDAWLCDRAKGTPTVAVGGSDTHWATTSSPPEAVLGQAVGFPTTWVRSPSEAGDDILAALTQGRVIVGDPRTHLRIKAVSGERAVGPGEQLEVAGSGASAHIEASVTTSGMRLQLIEVKASDCTDDPRWTTGEAPTYVPTYLLDMPLEPEDMHKVQVDVDPGSTVVARVWPETAPGVMVDGVAIASPITVGD